MSQKVYAPGSSTPTVSTYIGTVYEQTGKEKIKYIYAGSQRVAQISSTQGSTYFTNDHQGSASLLTDTSGAQVQSMAYLPFGGTFQTAGSKTSSWRYTGQRQDDSTGLYYYNARYYDPTIGRFLTPDTIVQSPYDPQFLNRYAYCRNNPINLVDPTGHVVNDDKELDLTGNGSLFDPLVVTATRPENYSWLNDPAYQAWLPGYLSGLGEIRRKEQERKEQEKQAAYAKMMAKEMEFLRRLAAGYDSNFQEGWMPTGHGMSASGNILLAYDRASVFPVLDVGEGEGGAVGTGGVAAEAEASLSVDAAAATESRLVIGRGADLAKPGVLGPGEYKLSWPSTGETKSEWKINSGLLREEMRNNRPIRDASPNNNDGMYLNAERNLLKSSGWERDESTHLWNPPKK